MGSWSVSRLISNLKFYRANNQIPPISISATEENIIKFEFFPYQYRNIIISALILKAYATRKRLLDILVFFFRLLELKDQSRARNSTFYLPRKKNVVSNESGDKCCEESPAKKRARVGRHTIATSMINTATWLRNGKCSSAGRSPASNNSLRSVRLFIFLVVCRQNSCFNRSTSFLCWAAGWIEKRTKMCFVLLLFAVNVFEKWLAVSRLWISRRVKTLLRVAVVGSEGIRVSR